MKVPIYRVKHNSKSLRKLYTTIRKEKGWKAINRDKFLTAYSEIFDHIALMIIYKQFKWRMPRNYGYLWISVAADMNSNDPKEVERALTIMDRVKTGMYWNAVPDAKKLNQKIYYDNFHTNGISYKTNYDRAVASSARNIYKFKKTAMVSNLKEIFLTKRGRVKNKLI